MPGEATGRTLFYASYGEDSWFSTMSTNVVECSGSRCPNWKTSHFLSLGRTRSQQPGGWTLVTLRFRWIQTRRMTTTRANYKQLAVADVGLEISEPPQNPPQSSRAGNRGNCNSLKGLAPQVGLEPTTLRLTAGCSTIELLRNTLTAATRWARRTSSDEKDEKHVARPNPHTNETNSDGQFTPSFFSSSPCSSPRTAPPRPATPAPTRQSRTRADRLA